MVIPYTLCFYTFSLISLVFAHNPKMFPLFRIVSYKTLPHAIIIYYIVSSSLSLHHLPLWPHTSLSVPHSWSISSLKTAPYIYFFFVAKYLKKFRAKKKRIRKTFCLSIESVGEKWSECAITHKKPLRAQRQMRCGAVIFFFFSAQNRPKMPVFVLMKRTNW